MKASINTTSNTTKFRNAVICAAVSTVIGATFCHAAPPPLINPTGTPAAPIAPAAPLGEGLAGLDDHALGAELSSRGLTTLLDDYFKVNHIAEAEQQAIKTFGALRELRAPGAKVTVGEKMRRVNEVAKGIDTVLPSLKDPTEMLGTAGTLVEFGVNPDINDIEYWGEDPVTQANLKPLADAVVKLLDTAAKAARKQADDLSMRLKGGNDPNADRWEKLDALAGSAAYNKEMSVYFAAAARSPKDPERKTMAAKAMTGLAEFDNDGSGVQPRIRNMLGKLQMVSGDYDKARKTFATVIAITGLTPPPNPYEQLEARYFTVVCDILAKDLAAAKGDEAMLGSWLTGTMPQALEALKIPPAQAAADVKANAAAQMLLQWRIDSLEEDLAKAQADKDKARLAAETVVAKLREAHPELSARIDQQLVKRMPSNGVIDDKMAPSLLVALEKKGLGESYKKPDENPDLGVIKKGIEAAQAIVKRKGAPGITAAEIEEAQLAIAQLHNYLGDKVAAANAFIDYAQANYTMYPAKAKEAFDVAGYLVLGVMKKMQPNAPAGFAEVYARFLPIAINPPYNHTELAYSYAEQLRALGQFAPALKFFRMVPKTDTLYPWAKYREMETLESLLDTKQDPATHKQTVTEVLAVAEELKKLSDPPKDDYDRNHALDAIGLLADLYRIELKDPKRTLEALQGYDQLVDGLSSDGKTPAEIAGKAERKAALKHSALISRINADMALGKSNEAVQEVTKLLENAKGEDGINFVKVLLDKLNKDYANADIAHNIPVMKETSRNTALLTGYLVKYSNPATQKNPKVAQYYYAYAAWDARSQRVAGSLADDPAERKKLLEAAAERFRFLQSAEMHRQYIEQPEVKGFIAAGKVQPDDPDWQVQAGLALADFDLGDFKDARDLLEPIIALKKLGTDSIAVVDQASGQTVNKPNDLYWEALYKYLQSAYEVSKNDPQGRADAIKYLKSILFLGGIPERWQDEFESLRKEAIPDFNPDKPVGPKPAVPTSAPTAAAVGAK